MYSFVFPRLKDSRHFTLAKLIASLARSKTYIYVGTKRLRLRHECMHFPESVKTTYYFACSASKSPRFLVKRNSVNLSAAAVEAARAARARLATRKRNYYTYAAIARPPYSYIHTCMPITSYSNADYSYLPT